MANNYKYFVRLQCGEDPIGPLFVPLDRDPQIYRLDARSNTYYLSGMASDSQALMGTTINGDRAATVGDLRQGRARDIAFPGTSVIYTERLSSDVYKAVDDDHNGAERLRDLLIRISGPVYGIRIEDVPDKYPCYPSQNAQVLVSAALFRILNPLVPVSDHDTVYVVSHKALTEWKPS